MKCEARHDIQPEGPLSSSSSGRKRIFCAIQPSCAFLCCSEAHPYLDVVHFSYDVAKMLGDTIDTVERHYTPFVKELRDRVRNILETGIEEAAKMGLEGRQNAYRKPS
jgi:hypothetical protein